MHISASTMAVIGLGYVGLPLALLGARKGYDVVGIDIDREKLRLLKKRKNPFRDNGIEKDLKEVAFITHLGKRGSVEKRGGFMPTSEFKRVGDVETIVLCLPTPVDKNHVPDLTPLTIACEQIAPWLKAGQLVILESTVNPGVSEKIVLPILERGSNLTGGKDFYLAHCPERVDPGNTRWTLEKIPRVVGSLEGEGLTRALAFYHSLIDAPIAPMVNLREAEAVKIVENTFRDVNIAFVNELAMSFARLKIDVVRVIEAATTKPFSFLAHYPGCGVGGHCIPVDPYYLIAYAQQNGFQHDFLKLARQINNHMPEYTVGLLKDALHEQGKDLKKSRVAVLGLSYKPEIDDCRESPAFEVIAELERHGAQAVSFDPFVAEKRRDVGTLEEALRGAQAAIITTAHKVFASLTPLDFLRHGVSVLIDGRNCLPKDVFVEAGMVYRGIGR